MWQLVALLGWLTSCSTSSGLNKKPRLTEAKIFQIRHLPAHSLGRITLQIDFLVLIFVHFDRGVNNSCTFF
jgi:hypothetical protein